MTSPDEPPPPDSPSNDAPSNIDGSPQALALGLTTLSWGPGTATLMAPYRAELVGDPDTGVIAGGVVTTLLDHACGQAVFAALGQAGAIATLDLRIDYMRAAEPGLDVRAMAHCYKLTRRIAFVRATAYDRDIDDPVATAQAAFMLGSRAQKDAPAAAASDGEAGQ
jgi:uncharacterized protein (TIGR00369 family)